jgi:hypothetical protein
MKIELPPIIGYVAPEIVSQTPELFNLMALTKGQAKAIDIRDEKHCLARLAHIPHECSEPQGIERHHIIPQRYALVVNLDPDVPENIASLCKTFHREYIHPDVKEAMSHYQEDKAKGIDTFHQLFDQRQEKLENREVYWNTEYDRILGVQAQKQNTKARKEGWKFPLSRAQKKDYGRDDL